MDEAGGFFPERKLLAYRRSLLKASSVPGPIAEENSFPWWIVFVCSSPSYMSFLWGSMYPGHLPRQIKILMLASVGLMACALIAVAAILWIYKQPRTQKLFTPE